MPTFNVSFALFDPGRQAAPSTTECQIRALPPFPRLHAGGDRQPADRDCELRLAGAVSVRLPANPAAGLERDDVVPGIVRQFSASDGGTTEALSVQLTVTDAVGNTATVRTNAGNQPGLSIRFFTCGI